MRSTPCVLSCRDKDTYELEASTRAATTVNLAWARTRWQRQSGAHEHETTEPEAPLACTAPQPDSPDAPAGTAVVRRADRTPEYQQTVSELAGVSQQRRTRVQCSEVKPPPAPWRVSIRRAPRRLGSGGKGCRPQHYHQGARGQHQGALVRELIRDQTALSSMAEQQQP